MSISWNSNLQLAPNENFVSQKADITGLKNSVWNTSILDPNRGPFLVDLGFGAPNYKFNNNNLTINSNNKVIGGEVRLGSNANNNNLTLNGAMSVQAGGNNNNITANLSSDSSGNWEKFSAVGTNSKYTLNASSGADRFDLCGRDQNGDVAAHNDNISMNLAKGNYIDVSGYDHQTGKFLDANGKNNIEIKSGNNINLTISKNSTKSNDAKGNLIIKETDSGNTITVDKAALSGLNILNPGRNNNGNGQSQNNNGNG